MQSQIRPKTDQAQNVIVLCSHNVRLAHCYDNRISNRLGRLHELSRLMFHRNVRLPPTGRDGARANA